MDTREISEKYAKPMVIAGSAVVLAASAYGFYNTFAMSAAMPGMSMPVHSSASHPLRGMPLSHMPEMFIALVGLVIAAAGALLQRGRSQPAAERSRRGKLLIIIVATAALTIDVSKTSTLGFVIPGMRDEYGLTASSASFLAVAGLAGTATGAVVFGLLADRIGRRGSYLLATLGFTATSMCGSMPDFTGNLVMCALMGVAVGGLAPLLITMLVDVIGGSGRGSAVVALSVVATAGGYLMAAGSALWLEPIFGWRVLWLIGAPTGLVLALLTPLVPRWTGLAAKEQEPVEPQRAVPPKAFSDGLQRAFALLIGVLTFGLTTWIPSLARLGGVPVATANLLLTVAAVVMVPCALVLMLGYRRFGPVLVATGLAGTTAVLLLVLTASGAVSEVAWLATFALAAALFSVNTMAAIFLPIAADLADPRGRGRTTGTVSLYNRIGGLCGPLLLAGLVSSASAVMVAVSVLALLCAAAAWLIGRRHRAVLGRTAVVRR